MLKVPVFETYTAAAALIPDANPGGGADIPLVVLISAERRK
jgi:hypothetical protein